jgi:hypothetical protein
MINFFSKFNFVLSQKRKFFHKIFRRKYLKNHNIGPSMKVDLFLPYELAPGHSQVDVWTFDQQRKRVKACITTKRRRAKKSPYVRRTSFLQHSLTAVTALCKCWVKLLYLGVLIGARLSENHPRTWVLETRSKSDDF